jgi:hypothetical protein
MPAFFRVKGYTMPTTQLPMASERIGIRPPPGSQIPVAEQLVQTLAQILAHNAGERIVLMASPSGVLYTASPRLSSVFHWTASAPNTPKQGENKAATEILCMAHPDNTGRVWVCTKIAAASNNAFPLDKGDVIGFSVENLSELRALIVANGDTLIVGYSL